MISLLFSYFQYLIILQLFLIFNMTLINKSIYFFLISLMAILISKRSKKEYYSYDYSPINFLILVFLFYRYYSKFFLFKLI